MDLGNSCKLLKILEALANKLESSKKIHAKLQKNVEAPEKVHKAQVESKFRRSKNSFDRPVARTKSQGGQQDIFSKSRGGTRPFGPIFTMFSRPTSGGGTRLAQGGQCPPWATGLSFEGLKKILKHFKKFLKVSKSPDKLREIFLKLCKICLKPRDESLQSKIIFVVQNNVFKTQQKA